jgi:hypothetical protein
MRTLGSVAVLVVVMLSTGCRQRHLSRDFGVSYGQAFAAQQERRTTPPPAAVLGLDSQEAAITADNYRAGLAPKGGKVEEQPTVIIAPSSRDRPPPLAPSVPKE